MENPFSIIGTQKIAMSMDDYRKLPHHPAFKQEYLEGELWISPRWRSLDLYLPINEPESPAPTAPAPATIRRLEDADWEDLPELFARSIGQTPPLSLIPREQRDEAGRRFMEYARAGGDGPLIPDACFVARDAEEGDLDGAILIGELEGRGLRMHGDARGAATPPAPPLPRDASGPPHLNWIFVRESTQGEGIGTALLARATATLWDLGHRELASTIFRGNAQSMAFHWAAGFRLLPRPDSPKRLRRRWPPAC
ncbi:Acetyltransferase (GNAT) family protein [Aquisphaera giovannonii]|uniref:Acetyltransferase (GNAT) family protein n=1 Tax=Aquisphaera giovannonii TaxID=406548 RepID=A0A5B9W490_9BACT|nr:GNAT family N-acetyltransferase [Aquisphaera giovannonii]QEH35074.1 Acetyltransferase (GNAT) family protein [Aquisphaera giovannonii]